MTDYDIIGDIHGQADKLTKLLDKLGYEQFEGVYQWPDSKVVFLGDLIDRGPYNRRVIDIVRPMVEQGFAYAVMGNHEFNAICYHTRHPDTGQPLRSRDKKNQNQHKSFLDEYPLDDEETQDVVTWFKTLPLFLELDASACLRVYEVDEDDDEPQRIQFSNRIRFVHACWDQDHIDYITERLGYPTLIDDTFLVESSEEGTRAFEAIETLLKGPEIPLPEGASFFDKGDNERRNIRRKWWAGEKTYRDAAIVPNDQLLNIPHLPLPERYHGSYYSPEEPPVFFGHYWMEGEPQAQRHNVACLDYSAGKGGPLAAYRWYNGGSRLGAGCLRGDQFITTNDDLRNEPLDNYTYPEEQRRAAWKAAKNTDQLRNSEQCGCFYCLSVFDPIELDPEDDWPQCPRCGIDYVIGTASGLPLTRRFLAEVKQFWLEPPFPGWSERDKQAVNNLINTD